jgi:hypothetical protein
MIVAVFFGSRGWADAWAVEEIVDTLLLNGDGSLRGIHGGAPGLDSLADAVLRRRGFQPTVVKAAWTHHDRTGATPVPCRCASDADRCRAAGIRRNQLILDEYLAPAIAEPDAEVWACGFRIAGRSPGTDDMRDRLRPLVAAGQVHGLMRRAEGMPPPERRRLWGAA